MERASLPQVPQQRAERNIAKYSNARRQCLPAAGGPRLYRNKTRAVSGANALVMARQGALLAIP